MSIFNFNKKSNITGGNAISESEMASLALKTITDGVLIVDHKGNILFINPAAVNMTGYKTAENALGLDCLSVLKLENQEGMPVPEAENPIIIALNSNQPVSTRDFFLATESSRKAAIALSIIPTDGANSNKIITFRNITKELEEENAQTEFISTASHEMRTPVASIEGYLGLALNPQCATIDDRAKQYLTAAHTASQHLGHLFKDLLDTTKLDDGRLKPHLIPVDIIKTVKEIADSHARQFAAKQLKYTFGTQDENPEKLTISQIIYSAVDPSFLREVLDNIIENAIKYTPEGGAVWINARGDGDKVLINVTDSGIGISADDLSHIFQKFYRADNSQTQTIGGTGLGLYLVKQRTEAMGGRVWAESSFGDGTTFYITLPRLSPEEYERRKLAYENEKTILAFNSTTNTTKGENQNA